MKLTKALLIPLLFLVTSCVSIDDVAKGSIFDASSGVDLEDPFQYYAEGSYGDVVPTIGEEKYELNFANDEKNAAQAINTHEEMVEQFPKSTAVVQAFTLDNIYKGVYGLKINYQKGKNNILTFDLLDEIQVQYVSIKCYPAFYNNLVPSGENAGKYEFACQDSALKLIKADDTSTKYVKLAAVEEKDEARNSKKAKEYTVTFDLGSKSNKFSIATGLYSTVISAITLY